MATVGSPGPEQPARRLGGLLVAAAMLAALLCAVLLLRPFNNSPDIRSDGTGYHIWVHALAHGDFSFCKYKELLAPVGAISDESHDGQRCLVKYPPGVGLLQLPFSLPGLAVNPERDGFSAYENRVVLWGGGALLLATACLMGDVLRRRRLPVVVVITAVAALTFGTGLFHYATYDASFSHVYSAFGVALLIWLTDGRRLSLTTLLAVGLVAAWLYSVRQTNAALSLAALFMAARQAPNGERIRMGLAWFTGTGCAAVLMLAYARYASGAASLSSYGSEGFPAFAGHSLDVLFSYERGLFSYYPVLLLVVLLALRDWRNAGSQMFLGLLALFTLLYGSWHSWYLGAGFGHRGFVELAPFGMLVLGQGLATLPRWPRIAGMVTAVLLSVATLSAMISYWHGYLPFSGASRGQYWKSMAGVSVASPPVRNYTVDELRHLRLSYMGARQMENGRWQVRLRADNTNADIGINLQPAPAPVLRLSWRFAPEQAGLQQGWDPRQALPEIPAGESRRLTVLVSPPADAASLNLHLQFSIVQDGVFWAHDVGIAPLSVLTPGHGDASHSKTD